MKPSADTAVVWIPPWKAAGQYAILFLCIRGAIMALNGPIAEYDTIAYLRGGLDWDIFHPPVTNILLALFKAIWPSMWLPALIQLLANACASAFLANALFRQHRWLGLAAIALAAMQPVPAFHTLTLLSEGWYMPVISSIVALLLYRVEGKKSSTAIFLILVALAPWIRLQATVELGLLLACFFWIKDVRKVLTFAVLVLFLSALLLHLTYRYRFTVSPFDASVRSAHATSMIPDPLPKDGWNFMYGYQEMYNDCISHDTHPDEHARHRACLDLLAELPGTSFAEGVSARFRLNLQLAFSEPFLSEHQQHKLDMAVPDKYTMDIYGTRSWPYRSSAWLPVPNLLPWLTLLPWITALILLVYVIITGRFASRLPLYAWLVAIPLVVLLAFFYKERFLAAWHAVVILGCISGIGEIFYGKYEGKA